MMSGGHEVDVGGGEDLLSNEVLDFIVKHSIAPGVHEIESSQ